MHDVIAMIHGLCAGIETAERAGCAREQIERVIAPARRVHSRSAFIGRLQAWPRGYPGDFETIEWLADGRPRCDLGDPTYWIEWYALNCAIAQQHRNKLIWQHTLMAQAASEGGRILSVGCGGCADAAIYPPAIANAEFVLVDTDADALGLAQQRIRAARSVEIVQKDAVRGLKEIVALGPYDLIVCGGLFDYLRDYVILRLIKSLYERALRPGKTLAFTNINTANEFRVWIEYLASWNLIHRSDKDIREAVRQLELAGNRLIVETDSTGIALLCKLEKTLLDPSEPISVQAPT
jgi:hypothetical protein